MSDALHDLLTPSPRAEPVRLREELLAQTTHWVHRRRMRRRLTMWSAVAACLIVSATVAYVRWPFQPVPEHREVADLPPPQQDRPPQPPVPAAPREPSSLDLEWQAFDSKTNRAATYFRAGNKYLEANQDMESALRCYAQAIDACAPEELEIRPEDNWLVTTLKNARRKELAHD